MRFGKNSLLKKLSIALRFIAVPVLPIWQVLICPSNLLKSGGKLEITMMLYMFTYRIHLLFSRFCFKPHKECKIIVHWHSDIVKQKYLKIPFIPLQTICLLAVIKSSQPAKFMPTLQKISQNTFIK
jgi:hypothetical protein